MSTNISRMHHDTHIILEDPWTHWPDKQDEIIKKAPIALGVSALAHLELELCGPILIWNAFFIIVVAQVYKLQCSGVQQFTRLNIFDALDSPKNRVGVEFWPVSAFQICVLFWILILNSQKSNNSFCAGSPLSESRTGNPYLCGNGIWVQTDYSIKQALWEKKKTNTCNSAYL